MAKTTEELVAEELGLGDVPESARGKILEKMSELALKKIVVAVAERLSAEELDELEKMKGTASPGEIDAFLASRVEGYPYLVKKTLDEFKEEMKSAVEELKGLKGGAEKR